MKTLQLLTIFTGLLFISCSDPVSEIESTEKEETQPKDEYYVQYSATNYRISSITYTGPNGSETISYGGTTAKISSWTDTFGPVYKPFKAYISVRGHGGNIKPTTVSIRISKNGGPFTLKAYDSSNMGGIASASYSIDF